MRKRLIRGLIFIAVAVGVAVGASSAAGAIDLDIGGWQQSTTEGSSWT
jgi:hypothetical protein